MTFPRLVSYGFAAIMLAAAAVALVVARCPAGLLFVGSAVGSLLTHGLLTDDEDDSFDPDAGEEADEK
jgi:hypothetical protein